MTDNLLWWQKAVFYQVYPRSFADGDGDGIGDLHGLLAKLDYLQWLGIDAIWLSPHFPSPQADCGYDVADYTDVDPDYGTVDLFKQVVEEAHKRDIRIILDLVLNHTSDQHYWFQESRSSLNNPHRDWYIWRDGKDGGPPNNWQSTFGGSAWEYDEATGQYYYHFFLKEQPDLNWRNPAVEKALFDAVRFWYDLGVDGFRLDAIGTIFEDPNMPDHTAEYSQAELHKKWRDAQSEEEHKAVGVQWDAMMEFQTDQPGVHDVFRALRQVNDEYPERMLVGETERIEYHGNGEDELHMVFNFDLTRSFLLSPTTIRENQEVRLAALPPNAWPCNTLGNHDMSRVWTHFGDGTHDEERARLSLALMLTLRGTPFLYNGEEIGMTDYTDLSFDQLRDMISPIRYKIETEILETSPDEALEQAIRGGRDKCRTPMQWSNRANGGFSPEGVTTWLPVNPNYAQGVNVEEQMANPDSMLHFYRTLLHLRRATPALIAGNYRAVAQAADAYFAFLRETEEQRVLVILNYSAMPQNLHLDFPDAKVLYSSHEHSGTVSPNGLQVAPWEIFIAELA